MFSLNATEDQLDFPVIYGSAKNNWMSTDWKTPTENLVPFVGRYYEAYSGTEAVGGNSSNVNHLFETIQHIQVVLL